MKKFLLLVAVTAITAGCSQHEGGDHGLLRLRCGHERPPSLVKRVREPMPRRSRILDRPRESRFRIQGTEDTVTSGFGVVAPAYLEPRGGETPVERRRTC